MNYNIKENKFREFQEFIKKNQQTKAEHAPKGWKYLGTYCYVLGFGPYHAAVMWDISDYADFDALRNHDDPVFQKFMFYLRQNSGRAVKKRENDAKNSIEN